MMRGEHKRLLILMALLNPWTELCESSINTIWNNEGLGTPHSSSMERHSAVGWRKLGYWTRARCRASFDALIGHEAQPSTDAALVSNQCLRSISL
uniref:Putative secreted protein n=1 Tax=Ixodes ricinus TaxID=34613 RepID=A0A6B0U3P3_IXORI